MLSTYAIWLLVVIQLLIALTLVMQFQYGRLWRKEKQERGTMVALLTHRLRSPLTAIKWNTELLLDKELGALADEQKELIVKMNTSIVDAIHVLNTFLETSRIERGEITGSPVSVDLIEYLPHIIDSYRGLLKEKKQTLDLEKNDRRILVFMDPLVLHTVVEVILHNAILYTPEGGVIRIKVDENSAGKKVLLKISDSGMGISLEDQKKLFTKFFRSSGAKTVSTTGNGLGLYLVKQMLQSIHGSIVCTSELGKGTTFSIGLPRA